jgi:hypothetical protein
MTTPVRQCVAVRCQCVNAVSQLSASVRQCVYRNAHADAHTEPPNQAQSRLSALPPIEAKKQ